MKILHIITQGTWGGAQRYVEDLITHIPHQHSHTIAIGAHKETQDLQSHLSSYISLTHLKRNISPIHDIIAIKELANIYKKIHPDIVHLNSSKAGILGSLAAHIIPKKHRPKIVYTAHGWVFNETLPPWKKNLYILAEKYSATYKDAIITLSPQDTHTAKTVLHIPSKKIYQIPLGIENIIFLPKKEAQQNLAIMPSKKIIIGCIANHYKTKGLNTLIESYATSTNLQKNTQLYLIGDGPEQQTINALIKKNKQEKNIILCGKKTHAAQLLKAFDLCVIPSHKEGLPYALLEILQAKIPVIATKVGGIPSLITHKKTGLLCEPQNNTSLKTALEWAITHTQDMTQYAKHAQQVGMQYSLTTMIKKTTTLYKKLLNNSHS